MRFFKKKKLEVPVIEWPEPIYAYDKNELMPINGGTDKTNNYLVLDITR